MQSHQTGCVDPFLPAAYLLVELHVAAVVDHDGDLLLADALGVDGQRAALDHAVDALSCYPAHVLADAVVVLLELTEGAGVDAQPRQSLASCPVADANLGVQQAGASTPTRAVREGQHLRGAILADVVAHGVPVLCVGCSSTDLEVALDVPILALVDLAGAVHAVTLLLDGEARREARHVELVLLVVRVLPRDQPVVLLRGRVVVIRDGVGEPLVLAPTQVEEGLQVQAALDVEPLLDRVEGALDDASDDGLHPLRLDQVEETLLAMRQLGAGTDFSRKRRRFLSFIFSIFL